MIVRAALALACLLWLDRCASGEDSDGGIVWQPELRVKRCERVFASPHDPFRVWACTAQGIVETTDDGATWNPLPGTGRDRLGRISDVLFAPAQPGVIWLGSREQGVFRSDDDGATWRSLGAAGADPLPQRVVRLGTPPLDRSGRILYVAHGDAAPGVSKTIDGGATWFTVCDHLYAEDLLLEGDEILVTAHAAQEQDLWSMYQSDDGGASWLESLRDVRPTAAGVSRSTLGSIWLGALKGRILHRVPSGRSNRTASWLPVGPEAASWASIFGATGAGGRDLLFAYDPRSLGLVVSDNGFMTWRQENDGLFVGPLVKEGAGICATANGRSFYAAINGQLSIGRRDSPAGPNLARFSVTPRIVHVSGIGRAAFSARVLPADDAPESKIAAVEVRLNAFHLPLLDDGQHQDAAAGDGVFAASLELKEDFLQAGWRPEDRWRVPGQVMLEVVATDAKQRQTVAKLPFSMFPKPQRTVFWDGDGVRWGTRMANARRSAGAGKFDSRKGIIFDIDAEAHAGARCLHVVAWRGPWLTGWGLDYYDGTNITDLDDLVFWIKATGRTKRDIQVLLTDAPGHEDDARQSEAVWLIKDGFLSELTDGYQLVRIPVTRFAAKTGFNPERCNGIAFGGDDLHGHNVFVDDIAFESRPTP